MQLCIVYDAARPPLNVMAALEAAIQGQLVQRFCQALHGRDKPGHDVREAGR
jgi:hypothetical protein